MNKSKSMIDAEKKLSLDLENRIQFVKKYHHRITLAESLTPLWNYTPPPNRKYGLSGMYYVCPDCEAKLDVYIDRERFSLIKLYECPNCDYKRGIYKEWYSQ